MHLDPALREAVANANEKQKRHLPSLTLMPITHQLLHLALGKASREELERLIWDAIDDEATLSHEIAEHLSGQEDEGKEI